MTTTEPRRDWGPLSHPITTSVPDANVVWKDNAYLCFWDLERAVFGIFHASTSPNGQGRRIRFSLFIDGVTAEIIETLDPGTYTSPSISFDLDDRIVVTSDRLQAEITMAPRFSVAEFDGRAMPSLLADEPLRHYQQAAAVAGRVRIGDLTHDVRGEGLRDRTWGYRDESANFVEYVSMVGVFPTYAVTCMRFRRPDGSDVVEGFRMNVGDPADEIIAMPVTWSASGLLVECELGFADGSSLALQTTASRGGFWVPMGVPRRGPAMSAYDEVSDLRASDGAVGLGFAEQGIVRQIF
jgi:hypothetical protein